MKMIPLGSTSYQVPAVAIGCMRMGELDRQELNHLIHTSLEAGANFFEHADIYGAGECERRFAEAIADDPSIRREDLIIQSKVGIADGAYDNSRDYLLKAVDDSLERLQTDYLDVFLIHRPDPLVEPEEVAEAFDELEASGKVRHFGVSNHKPMQIELLKTAVRQPLLVNSLQFSLATANMVANGTSVNMDNPDSVDHDGSVLDYSRITGMTVQAWSPFQSPNWQGTFIGDDDRYPELNRKLEEVAEAHDASATTIAASWILRHPAKIQLISGTTREDRLAEIFRATDVELTRREWYDLFSAAGYAIP